MGSSPLARGLPGHDQGRRSVRGIIPARAGFTDGGGHGRAARWDHPRSRGVYRRRRRKPRPHQGSSPLARGLPALRTSLLVAFRIIPARAGFTSRARSERAASLDHPRSRGVYSKIGLIVSRNQGSSPLARGLLETLNATLTETRIIPARAGFTLPRPDHLRAHRDHPRSRGVYSTPEALTG